MNPTQPTATEWSIQHIVCPLAARDTAGAIAELTRTLVGSPGVLDPDRLTLDIQSREAHAPTYLGGGVAMPHARTTGVDRLVIAVGLSRDGLHWGSPWELARLVFLVGIPRDDDGGYLDMVRKITQTVRHLEWIEQAIACSDATQLAELLRRTIEL